MASADQPISSGDSEAGLEAGCVGSGGGAAVADVAKAHRRLGRWLAHRTPPHVDLW